MFCIAIFVVYLHEINNIRPHKNKNTMEEASKPKAILQAQKATLDEILFPVQSMSPQDLFGGYEFGGQMSTAIYAPTQHKLLHLGGSNYKLISNEELISPIFDKLKEVVGETGFEVQCWNEDDRRFSARFILKEKIIKVADNDMVNAMIEVQNSYDGSLKQSVGLSYYRQVCSNGMMGWRQEDSFADKHYKQIKDRYMDNLTRLLQRLDTLDNQLQQFKKLQERQITQIELEGIMEKIRGFKSNDSFPKKIIAEVPMKMYQEAEVIGSQPTAWLLYNGFNHFLNHDTRIGLAMDIKENIDRNILSTIRTELALN
jgi:Domain of unknown function (DUF932)